MHFAIDDDNQVKQKADGEELHPEEQVYALTHLCTNMFSVQVGVNNIVDAYHKKPYKLSLFKEAFKDQIFLNGFNPEKPIYGIQDHFTNHVSTIAPKDILSADNNLFMADILCEVFRGDLVPYACTYSAVQNIPVKAVKFGEQEPEKIIDNYEDYLLLDRMVRSSKFIQNKTVLGKAVWAMTDVHQKATYQYGQDHKLPTFTDGNKKAQRLSLTTPDDPRARTTRARWRFADAENVRTIGMHALHDVCRFYNENEVTNHINRFNKEYFPLLNHEINARQKLKLEQ